MTYNFFELTNGSYNGTVIDFFGFKGTRCGNGQWLTNEHGGDELVPCHRDGVKSLILTRIQESIIAGNGDRMAQLHLGPEEAVIAVLEEVISHDDLIFRTHGKVSHLLISGVSFEGHVLDIRVVGDIDCGVMVTDSGGNALEGLMAALTTA